MLICNGCENIIIDENNCTDDCNCGGQWVYAKPCQLCDEYVNEDELDFKICKKCSDENATFDNAIEFGVSQDVEVKINGFAANQLSTAQINEILIKELNQAKIINKVTIEQLAKKYCLDSEYEFKCWLHEKRKE